MVICNISYMYKTKILIVGGAGYIGGYLTDILSLEYEVTVYDNLLYESRFFKDVKFIHGDICDQNKLEKIINKYDVVVWLAAIVGDGACAINPDVTRKVNFDSLSWIPKIYKGKFIFMSTCSVYGANNDILDENSPTNPLSLYAETKLLSEKFVIENFKNHLIFRLGTLFGLGDKFSRVRLDLVLNALTCKATNNETLNVFGGEQWRPLLHVKDVSNAIYFCLKNNITGLYNLSYQNFTIKDISSIIENKIPNVNINYQEILFEDFRNYKVKNEKIFNLGWRPKYDVEFGIDEIYNLIKENRVVNSKDPIYYNQTYLKNLWTSI